MDCSKCEFMEKNKSPVKVKVKGMLLKPGKMYCNYGKIKEISTKALGSYAYPVWCPLNKYKGTCLYCGTQVREEEGEVCLVCKKKGLR